MGYYGKRDAEAEPEAKADAEADPYYLYSSNYGHHPYTYGYYGGYRYPYTYGYRSYYTYPYSYGYAHPGYYWGKREAPEEEVADSRVQKREAESEPEAKADPWLLYGGYYGYPYAHTYASHYYTTPYTYGYAPRYYANSGGAVHIVKRDAEAEPEANPDAHYYGGWGRYYGYGGYYGRYYGRPWGRYWW